MPSYPASAIHWLSVRQSFSALILFVTLVYCWTANYPCKDTPARSSARVSTIWDACVRYRTVSRDVVAQVVTSLVIPRLDYCNSVFSGLPASSLVPLQRVQNAAARLVLNLDQQLHITSVLQQLQWLPVKFCIIFKTMRVMRVAPPVEWENCYWISRNVEG